MERKWKVLSTKKEIPSLKQAISDVFEGNPHDSIDVYVGTDSQQTGKKHTCFVSVIALHIKGRGGRVFYSKHYEPRINNLRDRLIQEASYSIEVAREIEPILKIIEDLYILYGYKNKIDIIIHADVNSKEPWASNKFMREVMGYIIGNGYKCDIKPNANIASIVADKMTKERKEKYKRTHGFCRVVA